MSEPRLVDVGRGMPLPELDGPRPLSEPIGELGGEPVRLAPPDRGLGERVLAPRVEVRPLVVEQPQIQPIDRPLVARAFRPLPTSAELRQKAGDPKQDIRWFGVTIWRHSTGYKAILSGLDDYNGLLANPPPGQNEEQQLDSAISKLEAMEAMCNRYLQDSGHTRGERISKLRSHIRSELAAARALRDGVDAANWPPGMSLATALDFARNGFSFRDTMNFAQTGFTAGQAKAWKDAGLSREARLFAGTNATPQQAREMMEISVDIADAAVLIRSGCSRETAAEFRRNGFSPDETAGLHRLGVRSAISYRLQGVPLRDSSRLTAGGVSGAEWAEFQRIGLTVEQAIAAKAANIPVERITAYRAAGFTFDDALTLFRGRVSPGQAQAFRAQNVPVGQMPAMQSEYIRLRIPWGPDTMVRGLHDGTVTDVRTLGSGALNTVYRCTYDRGGGPEVRVFKPENPVVSGWVSDQIGIDRGNPQFGRRNVATHRVAQALHFDVIPSCEFAMHSGHVGISMGMAPGTTPQREVIENARDNPRFAHLQNMQFILADPFMAQDVAHRYGLRGIWIEGDVVKIKYNAAVDIDPDHPSLRRELVKLQLVDALVGQGDRHAGNYLVERRPDGNYRVKGIDNDQCLGRLSRDPNDLAYGRDRAHFGFRGVRLPEVIDTEMRDEINNMSEGRLDTEIGHLVTPDELAAAKARLRVMKDHVAKLERERRVIATTDWGGPIATTHLTSETSYVARDRETHQRRVARGLVVAY